MFDFEQLLVSEVSVCPEKRCQPFHLGILERRFIRWRTMRKEKEGLRSNLVL